MHAAAAAACRSEDVGLRLPLTVAFAAITAIGIHQSGSFVVNHLLYEPEDVVAGIFLGGIAPYDCAHRHQPLLGALVAFQPTDQIGIFALPLLHIAIRPHVVLTPNGKEAISFHTERVVGATKDVIKLVPITERQLVVAISIDLVIVLQAMLIAGCQPMIDEGTFLTALLHISTLPAFFKNVVAAYILQHPYQAQKKSHHNYR